MARLLRLVQQRAVLIVLAALMGVWGAWPVLREGLNPPDSSEWGRHDGDVVMFRRGLDQTPRLSDTPRWFTGYWIGCNPFWRPLSSYGIWLMVRTLGWEHHDRFEVLTALSHVLTGVLLLWFAVTLTGRPLLALAAVALYNVGEVMPLARWLESPGIGGVGRWVYIPDIWLAMCVLPALALAWRGQIWWAALLAAAAAMVKETGFVAIVLVPVFYLWRWHRLHPAFWALGGAGAIMAALKLTFVGAGWVLGSNLSLWRRMLLFVSPEPVVLVITGMTPWALLGAGVAVAVIYRRSRAIRYAAIPVALLAATISFQLLNRPEPSLAGGIAFAAVIERIALIGPTISVALWIILAWAGLRGRDRDLLVLLAIGYLALGLPATLAPQTGERSYYTAWMLSALIKALCLWSLPAAFGTRRSPQAPPPDPTD